MSRKDPRPAPLDDALHEAWRSGDSAAREVAWTRLWSAMHRMASRYCGLLGQDDVTAERWATAAVARVWVEIGRPASPSTIDWHSLEQIVRWVSARVIFQCRDQHSASLRRSSPSPLEDHLVSTNKHNLDGRARRTRARGRTVTRTRGAVSVGAADHTEAPASAAALASSRAASMEMASSLEGITWPILSVLIAKLGSRVLNSPHEFNSLLLAGETKLDTLGEQFDALLDRMQTPQARIGMKTAFDASPKQLGSAAVAFARNRG